MDERKAIVAWLRQPVIEAPVGEYITRIKMAFDWLFRPAVAIQTCLLVVAYCIERGEHKETDNAE
jgi:hypothetical protein